VLFGPNQCMQFSSSVSVFKDVNTPSPFIEDLTQYGDNGESVKGTKPDHIYMDCMGFGKGRQLLKD